MTSTSSIQDSASSVHDVVARASSLDQAIHVVDPDEVAEPRDPLLMGFFEELKQKGAYDSLDIHSVCCSRGTEKDIVERICNDIADNCISDRVIWNAMRSRYPG